MIEPGPLLARGRACDVYELGPDRVLRRERHGRSCEAEAALMRHLTAHEYPVPTVHDTDGADIVLDRVDGPTMADEMARRPHRMGGQLEVLAALHERLHRIDAPPDLRDLGDGGTSVIHLDLHPLNVILAADGPVVIDWTNAYTGLGASDVAQTWVILATSIPDTSWPIRALARVMGPHMVRAFLRHCDVDSARRRLPEIAAMRARDPNLKEAEARRVERLRLWAVDGS